MRIVTIPACTLQPMWDVWVGEVKIGRLSDPRDDSGITHCTFAPAPAFDRYAGAFAPGDIWEANDDTLDAVIDEIAVEGVFLVGDDEREIIDPDLRIDGSNAWFQSSSST
jgi:hypothetical protein